MKSLVGEGMAELTDDCVCSGSLVYCELDGCGHIVSIEHWEDHLLAHQLADVVDPFYKPPVKEESTTVETTLATEEEGSGIQCQETRSSQSPPSQVQLPEQKDTLREQTNYNKQAGVATCTSAVDASSSDESDAECGICNQSVKVVHIADHMIAHELQAQEEDDKSTEDKNESEFENKANTTGVCRSPIPDNIDSELKEELSGLVGCVKGGLKDIKQEIGHTKISEVIEGVSEFDHEDLEDIVVEAKKDFKEIQSDMKELRSDVKNAFEDATIEDVVKVGLGCAKAVAGLTKDWWNERKANKRKSQALVSEQESTSLRPAMGALSLASEILVPHISELVRELVSKFNIPEDLLDLMCSDEHLLEIAHNVTNWEYLAHQLGLKETDIEEIEMNGPIQLQRLKVLQKWKQKFYYKATYRRLLEAFFRIERSDYANRLGRLLTMDDVK